MADSNNLKREKTCLLTDLDILKKRNVFFSSTATLTDKDIWPVFDVYYLR